ncbi:G-protein coupled receptors family 1 profile domain-containing protein [Caenorhabditis elegans]|uniref:G-protein coupled receptors family 1 profile domain-containing protein n=1 Tax=Caenorhabditis elegans TaxID=6239 RepID=Q9XVG1_CAEEL|nr:G-protein coupled receptors family 1 profile domain-containing protein [Caenorhabditis elegans]CAB03477.3 G-protein coupled receptors family 1 profile domain-containing protein [Caenorhabditis elegans]|eukprot:NP_496645.2 Uncharacterized protein CELE_W05H5.1 [Caenorhabditis elegans]
MSLKLYLITDCYCVFMAILAVFGNSGILYLFFKKRLDSRRNLRILLFMTVTDIVFAVSILPQIIYMLIYWEMTGINYDPLFMAIAGAPLPMFLKVSSVLNAGAATERILALYFPIVYRKICHIKYSNYLMALSFLLGSIDTCLGIYNFKLENRVNCSSIGCFVNDSFRTYWGASNMICGVVIIAISLFVFGKVRKLGKSNAWTGKTVVERQMNKISSQKFRLANRITCGILLSSLFCLTIPSLLVSMLATITGFSIFEKFGPFYVASLLTSGFANCLIFFILNRPVLKTFGLSDGGFNTATSTTKSSKHSTKPTIIIDLT